MMMIYSEKNVDDDHDDDDDNHMIQTSIHNIEIWPKNVLHFY